MPTVLGDFLAAAGEYIEAAVVVGDGQVDQLPEVARELHRLVVVMSRCLDDLTPYNQLEASGRDDLRAWERVVIDADTALHTAADHLRRSAVQAGEHVSPASWRARHLAAAANQLTAGRDLLNTHFGPGPDGGMRGRSEWASVLTSLSVTRSLTSEIARWSGQLASFTAWLASSAMPHSLRFLPGQDISAAVYDGLAGAGGLLQVASAAVLPAVYTDPVQATDTDLLWAIPAAMVPLRLDPGAAEESVSELCHGITISAARLRAAVRSSHRQAAWSPSATSGGWQWTAQAAAVTSHISELVLRSLSTRVSQLPASRVGAAQLDAAAECVVAMRTAWHQVDQTWDVLSTESRMIKTPIMTEASDLLLRMGRLAWDNPHWTPARADRAPSRSPANLAPNADAVNTVIAAAHQAVDAMACVAMADLEAAATADRAGRLYVPTRLLSDGADVPRRFAKAPLAQFRKLRTAYRAALDAGDGGRRVLGEIAVTARAPSMTLALARTAALVQSPRPGLPDNDDLVDLTPDHSPFRRSRASNSGAGPLEQALKDQQVSDPVILLRAAVIDNAAERLMEQTDKRSSATGSPEKREDWWRATRRATLLANESLPQSPIAPPSAGSSSDETGRPSTPAAVPRTRSPSQRPGRRT